MNEVQKSLFASMKGERKRPQRHDRDADRELALRLHNEEKQELRGLRRQTRTSADKAVVEDATVMGRPCETVTGLDSFLSSCLNETGRHSRPRASRKRTVENAFEHFSVAKYTEKHAKLEPRKQGTSALPIDEIQTVPIKDLDQFPSCVGVAENQKTSSSLRRQIREQIRRLNDGYYINCDLRYFNLAYLRECVGNFDVVLIDPPWRIAGGQRASTPNGPMFTNNHWAVNYNTLSNEEILDLDIGCLSNSGLCFLWVVSSQLPTGMACLSRWGYEYIDKITWIKKRQGKLHVSHGYHFMHSSELCLIGVKRPCEFIGKVSNDLIFAEVREKSRKPDELYHVVETMLPGTAKIELFARNHNIRRGWLSLGNELGEQFCDWFNDFECDMCGARIHFGERRYKAKNRPNSDFCRDCYLEAISAGVTTETEWFELANDAADPVYHEYYECNHCNIYPLWGVRFHRDPDMDLCEQCYDELVANDAETEDASNNARTRSPDDWTAIESPICGGSLPVHRNIRCSSCLQCPIIGYRFSCTCCENLSLCQKCFFQQKCPKGHNADHDIVIIVDSEAALNALVRCDGCGIRPILGTRYRCNTCYAFDLCETCYKKVEQGEYDLQQVSQKKLAEHNRSHAFSAIPVSA